MTHSLLLVQYDRDTYENLRLLQFNILTVCTYMCCSEVNSANVAAILNMQMSQMSPICLCNPSKYMHKNESGHLKDKVCRGFTG